MNEVPALHGISWDTFKSKYVLNLSLKSLFSPKCLSGTGFNENEALKDGTQKKGYKTKIGMKEDITLKK